jgi:hypothetical protein
MTIQLFAGFSGNARCYFVYIFAAVTGLYA